MFHYKTHHAWRISEVLITLVCTSFFPDNEDTCVCAVVFKLIFFVSENGRIFASGRHKFIWLSFGLQGQTDPGACAKDQNWQNAGAGTWCSKKPSFQHCCTSRSVEEPCVFSQRSTIPWVGKSGYNALSRGLSQTTAWCDIRRKRSAALRLQLGP